MPIEKILFDLGLELKNDKSYDEVVSLLEEARYKIIDEVNNMSFECQDYSGMIEKQKIDDQVIMNEIFQKYHIDVSRLFFSGLSKSVLASILACLVVDLSFPLSLAFSTLFVFSKGIKNIGLIETGKNEQANELLREAYNKADKRIFETYALVNNAAMAELRLTKSFETLISFTSIFSEFSCNLINTKGELIEKIEQLNLSYKENLMKAGEELNEKIYDSTIFANVGPKDNPFERRSELSELVNAKRKAKTKSFTNSN